MPLHLERADRAAELLALLAVGERVVEGPARRPEHQRGQDQPFQVQPGHQLPPPLADRADHRVRRHHAVGEVQVVDLPAAHRVDAADPQPRRAGRDQQHGQPVVVARAAGGPRDEQDRVREVRVRAPGLLPVDHPSAVRPGLGPAGQGRDIAAGLRLGHRDREGTAVGQPAAHQGLLPLAAEAPHRPGHDRRRGETADRGHPVRGLLQEHAGVHHAGLGHAEPAERRHLLVDRLVVRAAPALLAGAGLAFAEVAHRGREGQLFVGEIETHVNPFHVITWGLTSNVTYQISNMASPGGYPMTDVESAVAQARAAAAWWSALPFPERRNRLLSWKRHLAAHCDDLAAVIRAETGKPHGDALLEIMLAVEHLDWAARNAGRVLRRRRVRSGLLAADHGAALEYRPVGVVGAIGPWNYPVYTPLGSISYALAAGNAVVFKPSEHTPKTGLWLAEAWSISVPEQPVLQVVTGAGETGAALCRSGVDKIAFTGSAATARKVMAACAETLTPLVVEGGGKDAMIVAADANLDSAAEAAAFGGFGNAGQTCAGVERIYVERAVYPAFLARLQAIAERLRPGDQDLSPYGRMTTPEQPEIVRGHVADAVARGGRAVVGGVESVRPPFISPVVLAEVPEDSTAVTEETFGPSVVVNPVDSLDQAVELANASRYGLAASVFSGDRRKALGVTRRLRAGAASVNSVLGFAAIPALPFGGLGDSGFGRIHGADGLREFSRAHSVAWRRFPAPMALMAFDREPAVLARAVRLFKLRHARGGK